MDKAVFLGLLIGFSSVILGNIFEGGHTASLIQGTAFVIVMGGTWGAVLVAHELKNFKTAIQLLTDQNIKHNKEKQMVTRFLNYSKQIKKEGIVSIENQLKSVEDPWEKMALRMVLDQVPALHIKEAFESRIYQYEKKLLMGAKIFTDAGGYSPTIGILGAVLGLIHVMGNLSDTSKLGAGIAVAFVATIYGVGFANLLFLPMGQKLKIKIEQLVLNKQLILQGALMLSEDVHPLVIEHKLKSFIKNEEL